VSTSPTQAQTAQGAAARLAAVPASGYVPPSGVPTLAEVKEWLGLDPADTVDDELLQRSLDAAIYAQGRTCFYPLDDGDPPAPYVEPDLYEALLLRTQRYTARRSSPEGVVGISGTGGDFAAARLPSIDADIVRLEGPWMRTPVA
jgi:hypothetical protein